jgi:hypothetical protein
MEPVTRDVMLDVRLVAAGLHVHNGPVAGSIIKGSVRFQIDGGAQSVLEPGGTFFEPEDARIRRSGAPAAVSAPLSRPLNR